MEDGTARNGQVASDAGQGKLPEIDPAGLDAAVTRSIDEAMDAVQKDPRHAQRWGHLGMLLLAHDLFEPAAKCLSEAARLNQSEPLWPYFESIALRTLDPTTAIDRSRRAVELFGDGSVVPRTRLADMLIEGEQLDEAETVLSEVIRSEPGNVRAHVALAKLHLLKNQPQRALASIDRARDSTTPTRTMLLLAAEAHRRLGELDAAKKHGELSRTSREIDWDDPIYSQVLTLRTGLKAKLTEADRLFQQNRVDASIWKLEQLVTDYPDSDWARILLARGYIRKRRLKEAEATLKEALRLNSNSFQAHFRMGVVFQVGGQHNRAIEWFEKTVEIQPSSAVAFKNMALSRFLLDDREGAERDFRRAVEVQPNYFEGHLALGDFYLKSHDFPAARAAFHAALQLRPGDQRVAQMLKQLDSMP